MAGCGSTSPAPESGTILDTRPLVIDIFSARGFLGGSAYERYYFTQGLLWRECGDLALESGNPKSVLRLEGDEVLAPDSALHIRQRRVEPLSREQESAIKKKTSSFLSSLTKNEVAPPLPGSYLSMKDPGLFEMNVELGTQKQRLVTSVDAVADKQTPALRKMNELVAAVRGVGPTICESSTFFGISKSSM